ncbi:hypothetical protein RDMS_08060 [Deinococcus sp. RL]|uniref:DUF4007 family protein n=1 Tax=Deinococcus sp. RL TaxID=1489678 RepID=UPI0004D5A137|nr:DUF4007 family protein [Deinococcus sp. RL]KEF34343.1 hypothetical protein RDMS_08060 [Deinococcus sp. RL]
MSPAPASARTPDFAGPKLGFAGHETFPFRYGWLTKGLLGAQRHAMFFSQPSALVTLGVGKNMVQSIRHWGIATGVLEDMGRGEIATTVLGEQLLGRWDPYLEDAGSLWWLHWQLVNRPEKAAAWHYAFFRWTRQEFTRGELTDALTELAERQQARSKRSTIERDVDCLIRTYLPGKSSKKGLAEESFDCPLAELGLLRPLQDGDRYAFVIGHKRTLPVLIFGAALLEFLECTRAERQTVALHDALYGLGSPGQAFKLSENALVELIEAVQEQTGGAIELDDTAGLKQLYLRRPLDPSALLARHYEEQA